MEFGMFHEFPSLPGRSESEAFDEAMEQVDAAERLGLDVMWLAELHFEPRRSLLSAPLSIASAIAARTSRIKIGIAVQVLPLCHPLRLAEEAATVDQLSHGRLIFGVGRSGVAQTYEAYGVSYAESRDRFREILDVIQRAWTEPNFSYEGAYHRFNNISVVPQPYQKPTPPIRVAASTPDTFPAIGRRGAPIFASVRHTSWANLARQVEAYHQAWEAAGHPGRGEVFVSAPTYLAETEARARAEPRESIMHFYHEQANLLEGAAKLVDPETAARRMQRVHELRRRAYDDAIEANALIGTPETIAKKLQALQAEIGLSGILAELNCGGLIAHQQVVGAMRLLCAEVMPAFAR
ncbi:MAG TPA: LLM class flavin-dependent oxidoreductase [Stellaceae bacterium]|jgi:alkanesulfonate monooxygenase SsuD/methylene tetrahydromethanopterin reductase-like flavin-dependent oxidoreductase (luciferase family)